MRSDQSLQEPPSPPLPTPGRFFSCQTLVLLHQLPLVVTAWMLPESLLRCAGCQLFLLGVEEGEDTELTPGWIFPRWNGRAG